MDGRQQRKHRCVAELNPVNGWIGQRWPWGYQGLSLLHRWPRGRCSSHCSKEPLKVAVQSSGALGNHGPFRNRVGQLIGIDGYEDYTKTGSPRLARCMSETFSQDTPSRFVPLHSITKGSSDLGMLQTCRTNSLRTEPFPGFSGPLEG